MHFPTYQDLGITEGEYQTFLSVAFGILSPFLSSLAIRYQWSRRFKFAVVLLITVFLAAAQLALQGKLDGVGGTAMPLAKAFMLIFVASQATYSSTFVKGLLTQVETATSPKTDTTTPATTP